MVIKFRTLATSLWLFSCLLFGTITVRKAHARQEERSKGGGVPIDVLQKGMRFVREHQYEDEYGKALDVLQRLEGGDIHTLYKVAEAMNEMEKKEERLASVEIWHALAEGGHILSQVALGFAYSEHDKATAVTYFVQAGEGGPHQAALYNAGRLLADPDLEDFVKALAYIRAAYSLGESYPKYSTEHLTEISKAAYKQLSEQLTALVDESLTTKGSILSIQMVADMFLYANLNDYPPAKSKEEKIWTRGMQSLQSKNWEMAFIEFEKLEKNASHDLSNLQLSLLKALKQYCSSISGVTLGADEL